MDNIEASNKNLIELREIFLEQRYSMAKTSKTLTNLNKEKLIDMMRVMANATV